MAYNKDKYQLTHLLQDAWNRMGQFRVWTATGGSTTTLVNSTWVGIEDEVYEDDDPALIYGTVVVVRDAGLAGAAPEGEFGMITDYDSSTHTITMDAISAAIASGDKVGVASPILPLNDMMELANLALRKLGEIDVIDASLTTLAHKTEYTLPATIRQRPMSVKIPKLGQSGNNLWESIKFDVIPAAPGSNWTLVIPEQAPGLSIQITYRSLHPELTSYAADIQETIHPELALCGLLVEAYQWYNNRIGGTNDYFLQRENKALQDYGQAKIDYPIRRLVDTVSGLPHWGASNDYVPLTSDLRA